MSYLDICPVCIDHCCEKGNASEILLLYDDYIYIFFMYLMVLYLMHTTSNNLRTFMFWVVVCFNDKNDHRNLKLTLNIKEK